jgi:4-hydroxybenzoate polyprenyltransferase
MSEPLQMPVLSEKSQGARVVDAPVGNWVDSYAPEVTRPYLRLSRADRPIGTWLLFIPCLWGIALAAQTGGFVMFDLWLVGSCALGAFLMRGAGCTWNDITDREIDAAVARTRSRPLPSGQISVRTALIWMGVQALLAACVLVTYNALAIGLGLASLLLVAVYPFAKRFTWWPQVFLGLAFNWGSILAFAAHSGQVSGASILLYASGIMWTLYYDTIYAHQDTEDDALIGVKSTARLFGQNSRKWLFGFVIATLGLMSFTVLLAMVPQGRSGASVFVALLGVAGFGWHMIAQMAQLKTDDPASCVRIFRANRNAGMIPALFFAVAAFL